MLNTATRNRKLAKKRSVDLSGYGKYWEMREQGAGVSKDGKKIVTKEKKVFRCMCCGSTTGCKGDYNGEPDISKCTPECQAHTKATRNYNSSQFVANYSETFGHD